ncbi:MAG TPA: hypothetical protein VIY68_17020 [Steroidobacteraceae bacterium]
MGNFKAQKTQCLEASHPRRPFRLDVKLTVLEDEFRMAVARSVGIVKLIG